MTKQKAKVPWTEANQAFLVAEFARLKNRFASKIGKSPASEKTERPPKMEEPAAIERLVEVFGLSSFERDILLLCAGYEMDSEIAALCEECQRTTQRPGITFGLAMGMLADSHWSALTPSRPLRRYRLIEVGSGQSLTAAPLRIDERILHYLAGVNALDSRLAPLIQSIAVPEWIVSEHQAVASRAAAGLAAFADGFPLIQFCGDDASGQEDIAAIVARSVGCQLFGIRADELPPSGQDLDQFAILWEREALLLNGALVIQCAFAGAGASARHLAERSRTPVFLASREPIRLTRTFLRFDVNKPQPSEQKRLWQQALGPAAVGLNGVLDDLAEQFRLSARMIFA
ncbi:MAG: ATP-binding protein, partial [Silvibacterium sp.]|nr:ATP-binding protein [Silvibacterium sp.]